MGYMWDNRQLARLAMNRMRASQRRRHRRLRLLLTGGSVASSLLMVIAILYTATPPRLQMTQPAAGALVLRHELTHPTVLAALAFCAGFVVVMIATALVRKHRQRRLGRLVASTARQPFPGNPIRSPDTPQQKTTT